MGTTPNSGAISLLAVENALGGPASPSLANYYLNGAYVKPASNYYYTGTTGGYSWIWDSSNILSIYWGNAAVVPDVPSTDVASYSINGYTYYKGAGQGSMRDSSGYSTSYYYSVAISLNQNYGVPTSGTISLANLYGVTSP